MEAERTTGSGEGANAGNGDDGAPGASGGLRASPWVASTYFAEGLPYSIVHQISAQYFTALGASLPAIGLTSLYGLAWNLKFLWSPLIDRYGTTRRWLLATELALGALVTLVAWPAGAGELAGVARLLVPVAFLAATHDIAIDGFYLRALSKRDQTAFSGLRLSAYRGALLVGNGLLVKLAGRTSWGACFLACGLILLGLTVLHARLLPAERPDREEPSPAGPTPKAAAATRASDVVASPWPALGHRFFDSFRSFLGQPGGSASIAFILLFRAGDAMMFAMGTPFYKALGFDTDQRGTLNIFSTVASIVGLMGGSFVISRLGLRRTLRPITIVQSGAILFYAALAATLPGRALVTVGVVAEQVVAGVGTAAFSVFLMRRCAGRYKASHFAMASALMSVAATFAGSASGYLAAGLGFPAFFVLAFAASLPGVVLSWVVPVE